MTLESLRRYDGGTEAESGVKRNHDGDGSGHQDSGYDAHLPLGLAVANLPDSADDLDNPVNEGKGHDDTESNAKTLLELPGTGGLGENGNYDFSHNDVSLNIV